MNQSNTPTLNLVASTWLLTCLVFFITFGLFTKGVGNWFFSGVAAIFGALPILLFCLLGANLLRKIRTKNKLILIVLGTSLGLVFGFIGFYFANTVIIISKHYNQRFLFLVLLQVYCYLLRLAANKLHHRKTNSLALVVFRCVRRYISK